jgi:PAS domain S-box-containing protein
MSGALDSFSTVFELIEFPVFVIDKQEIIAYQNKEARILFNNKIKESKSSWKELFNLENENQTLREIIKEQDSNLPVQSIKMGQKYFKTQLVEKEQYFVLYLHDVTNEKLLIQSLKKSKKKYKDLINAGLSIIMRIDARGNILYMNKYGLHLLKKKFDELLGASSGKIFQSSSGINFFNSPIEALAEVEGYFESAYAISKQGYLTWIGWSVKPIKNKHNQIVEILCVGSNISDKKHVELENLEKQKYINAIFNAAPIGLAVINNNKIDTSNEGFSKILDRDASEINNSKDEIISTSPYPFKHYKSRLENQLKTAKVARTEVQLNTKHGAKKDIYLNACYLDEDNGLNQMVISAIETTEIKNAERIISNNQEKLRNIIDAANDAIILTDRESGIILDANYKTEVLLQTPISSLVGTSWENLFPKETLPATRKFFDSYFEDAKSKVKELSLLNQSKQWIPVEVSINSYTSFDGKECLVSIYRDIRDRKRNEQMLKSQNDDIENKILQLESLNEELVESNSHKDKLYEQLKESEMQYRQLFNSMVGAFTLNKMIYNQRGTPIDYIVLDANPSYEKLVGRSKHDIINKKASEILPENDSFWIENFGRTAKYGEKLHCQRKIKILNKYVDVIAYSTKQDFFAVVYSDITNEYKIQKDLEEREQAYKAMSENSPDIILRFDRQTKLLYASPNASLLVKTNIKKSTRKNMH